MHGLLCGVETSLQGLITERSGVAKHISTAFIFPGGQNNRLSPNVLAPTRQDVQKPLQNTLPTSIMQHPRLHHFTVLVQKWKLFKHAISKSSQFHNFCHTWSRLLFAWWQQKPRPKLAETIGPFRDKKHIKA